MSGDGRAGAPRRTSLFRDAGRRFARDRLATAGLVVLLLLGSSAAAAPLLARFAPNQVDLSHLDSPPSGAHWFGTDDLGRDEFSRALYAGRVSLSIGILSAVVAAIVGTTVGASAGYYGGLVEGALMRATDIVLSIPPLPLVIVLSAVVKPSPAFVGLDGPTKLMAYDYLVAVGSHVKDDTVYRIAKAMYENKPKLAESLRAFNGWDPATINKEMPAPFHPGSEKFFKEKNIGARK